MRCEHSRKTTADDKMELGLVRSLVVRLGSHYVESDMGSEMYCFRFLARLNFGLTWHGLAPSQTMKINKTVCVCSRVHVC